MRARWDLRSGPATWRRGAWPRVLRICGANCGLRGLDLAAHRVPPSAGQGNVRGNTTGPEHVEPSRGGFVCVCGEYSEGKPNFASLLRTCFVILYSRVFLELRLLASQGRELRLTGTPAPRPGRGMDAGARAPHCTKSPSTRVQTNTNETTPTPNAEPRHPSLLAPIGDLPPPSGTHVSTPDGPRLRSSRPPDAH